MLEQHGPDMLKLASRNLDSLICSLLCTSKNQLVLERGMTVSYKSIVGRRYDPRHGPSIYKNPHKDNTRLEGAEFDKHYRDKDDVEVDFADARIDRLKNPNSADVYYYHYYQSRQFARDVYAKYGSESGVNPSLCFPDEQELQTLRDLLDQEESVSEMLAEIKAEEEEFEAEQAAPEAKMRAKLSQMHEMVRDWKENERVEREAAEKKAKKMREYTERIRQQFGNRFPPHSVEHDKILQFLHAQDLEAETGRGKKLTGKAKRESKRKQLEEAAAAALKDAKNEDGSRSGSTGPDLDAVDKSN